MIDNSFVFFMRCKQFASTSSKVMRQLDHDRVVLLPLPSSTANNGTTTNNNNNGKGLAGSNSSAKAASWPPAVALREAMEIDRNFVRDGSPFEVNVSARCKASIAKALVAASAAVLSGNRMAINVSNTAPASPAQSPQGASGGSGLASPTPPPRDRSPAHGITMTNNTSSNISNGANATNTTAATPMVALAVAALPDDPDTLLLKSIISIFDEAVEEVKKLMMSNNWNRFRASSQVITCFRLLSSHVF